MVLLVPAVSVPVKKPTPSLTGKWGGRAGDGKFVRPYTDRAPWRQGEIRLPAIGLREAVLRAQFLIDTRQFIELQSKAPTSTERLVRDWARGIDCTREQWTALVRFVQGETVSNAKAS